MIRETAFITSVFAVPVLVLLGATNAFAAKAHPHKVTGEVIAINVPDQTIVIKRSSTKGVTELSLLVDSGSKVLVGKEKKSLSDVHVGDKVRGKYMEKDGKHVASTLHVTSTPGSEKKSDTSSLPETKPSTPTSPATQSIAFDMPLPSVTSAIRLRRSSSSVQITTSPERARISASCARRQITLMVLKPCSLANCRTSLPTLEPAAVWSNQSPSRNLCVAIDNPQAVRRVVNDTAADSSLMPSGTTTSLSASQTTR